MDRHEEHTKVIQSLLDGIDPVTKEKIPMDHVVQDPVVVKALCYVMYAYLQKPQVAPSAAPTSVAGNDTKRVRKPKVHKPWTPEDRQKVTEMHAAGDTLESIAQALGRPKKVIVNQIRQQERFEAKPNLLAEVREKRDRSPEDSPIPSRTESQPQRSSPQRLTQEAPSPQRSSPQRLTQETPPQETTRAGRTRTPQPESS